MKQTRNSICLPLAGLILLSGCQTSQTSVVGSASASSSTGASPVASASDSPQASVSPASSGLTQPMLSELSQGYQLETQATVTTDDIPKYHEVLSTGKEEEFGAKVWEESNQPEKAIDSLMYYLFAAKDSAPDSQASFYEKLTMANEVEKYPITDSNDQELTWPTCGFSNFWADLTLADFDATAVGNTFELYVHDPKKANLYKEIACQISGYVAALDFVLSGLTITTDGYHITHLETTFAAYDLSGIISSYAFSSDVLACGKDVPLEEIKPVTGTEDPDFKAALEPLRQGNFLDTQTNETLTYGNDGTVTRERTGSEIEWHTANQFRMETRDAQGQLTAAPTGGFQNGNKIQEIVVYGDNGYYIGSGYEGSLQEAYAPTFDLSSLLFKKEAATGSYVMNVPNYWLAGDDTHRYSGLFTGSCSQASLTFKATETDVVTVQKSTLTTANQATQVYTQVGQMKDPFQASQLKDDCSDVPYSKLLAYDSLYPTLVDSCVSPEFLDEVPVLGGLHSIAAIDNYGDIVYGGFASQAELDSATQDYEDKYASAGFTLSSQSGYYGGKVYDKDVSQTVSGVTTSYVLSSEVLATDLELMGFVFKVLEIFPMATAQ